MEAIEKGDMVDVDFVRTRSLFNCEVLYVTCSTGDVWILKSIDGTIYNVILFEKMTGIPIKDVDKQINHAASAGVIV